ncbi:2-amino-4-hydroxy-6-hydroxymethyldihydropteridine diphosphokinase [Alteromonas facilis]|uniref:2-amino-4-hydroxy-6- hydroxymethyldihydropteridine diphosphokinase n=1 Tax=Alteromonas facilis TaxID=2048004 RepID=UPI000C289FF8|nr:2-amino-4-hydroxy-6-hydroxymethyldihydropteridine diphosphokinase [Alteromonas facilis]
MNMHHILISLGTNIQREKHTRSGVEALKQHFEDVQLSSVYESESVGFDGDAFYNLVASAYTDLPVAKVCQILKQIEQDNGRKRGEKKFASRTLDLDLLTYDQLVTKEPVTLPRDEITYNAFVLQPLAELVPTHKHPVKNASYLDLWQSFDSSKQKLWPITFNWREGTHDAI